MKTAYKALIQRIRACIKKNISKIIFYGIIILMISIIIGILTGIYKIFNIIFPSIICLMGTLFILFKIIYSICRFATFPGSSWLWRRNIENHFARNIRHKCQTIMRRLEYITQSIMERKRFNNHISVQEIYDIRRIFLAFLNNFTQQKENQNISSYQQIFYDMLLLLQKMLKETKIFHMRQRSELFPYWKFFELQHHDNFAFGFENDEDPKKIIHMCHIIVNHIADMNTPKNRIDTIKRWIFDDTFGCIDHIREDLCNNFDGIRIKIPVNKKIILDCMLIKAKAQDDTDEYNTQSNTIYGIKKNHEEALDINDPMSSTLLNKSLGPTVILCNPNAGLYEFMYFENEWVEYYLSKGINLFLWNYRGYGRSTGSPHPKYIKSDGEAIVDYIRANYNVKKLGVHGESMGGMVASHIAYAKNLDFLCADRTFSSLTQVVYAAFGKFIYGIYLLITRWNNDSTDNYLDTSCYKILIFDPRDEVIPIPGSLKYGITQKIIERALGMQKYNFSIFGIRNWKLFSWRNTWLLLSRLAIATQTEYRRLLYKSKIQKYNELLTPSHMQMLFDAVTRISSIFIEFSKIRNISLKNNNRSSMIDTTPRMETSKKLGPKANISYDNTLNTTNYGYFQSNNNINNIQLESTYTVEDETVIGMIKHTSKTQQQETDITIEPKNYINEEKSLQKAMKKQSYCHLINEDTKRSDYILAFILQIFSIFETMEAGGIHLTDIGSKGLRTNFCIFKELIRSFEIWGSYQPIKYVIDTQFKDLVNYHQHSLNKIIEFLKKIDNFLALRKPRATTLLEEKVGFQKNYCQLTYLHVFIKLIEDLEIISGIFLAIYQKLHMIHSKKIKSNDLFKTIPDTAKDLNIDRQSKNFNRDNQQITNPNSIKLTLNIETDGDKIQNLATISNIGNLIPVTCGHNGVLNKVERALFDYHLRNSGFLNACQQQVLVRKSHSQLDQAFKQEYFTIFYWNAQVNPQPNALYMDQVIFFACFFFLCFFFVILNILKTVNSVFLILMVYLLEQLNVKMIMFFTIYS